MDRWCDKNYRYTLNELRRYRIAKPGSPPGDLEKWLNDVIGNEMNENLGWGVQGWKFWWNEYRLWKVIVDGVDTPYVYRLFDGRRKKWDGAKEAIYRQNGRAL